MARLTPSVLGFFCCVSEEIRVRWQHYEKTDEQIRMEFYPMVGHETRNNLEHFRDVSVNLLNPGLIFLFASNDIKKRVNGFSWNFHEISGLTQEIMM